MNSEQVRALFVELVTNVPPESASMLRLSAEQAVLHLRGDPCGFWREQRSLLNSLVVQQDGTIVLGGLVGSLLTNQADFGIAELTPSGKLNAGFDTGGETLVDFGQNTDANLSALVVRGDGSIVVAGTVVNPTTGADFAVAELTPSGHVDGSLGMGGVTLIDFGLQDSLFAPNLSCCPTARSCWRDRRSILRPIRRTSPWRS
jgi:hypothetical protein